MEFPNSSITAHADSIREIGHDQQTITDAETLAQMLQAQPVGRRRDFFMSNAQTGDLKTLGLAHMLLAMDRNSRPDQTISDSTPPIQS